MPANNKLVPKTGKLKNPEIPVDATNPKRAGQSYEADARGSSDQDGNQEHARRQGAAGPQGQSPDRPRPAKR